MCKKRFITDIAIIAIVVLIGTLIYFAVPRSAAAPQVSTGSNLSASNNATMSPTEAQLKIEVIKEGTGEPSRNGETLVVNYTGMLEDGTVFDSSIPRGEPFSVTLGKGDVIPGWELGLLGMKVGEERKLIIPPDLAYGKNGIGGVIPPNATLIFDVQLLKIQ